MRLLVIFAHPSLESFNAAIFRTVVSALEKSGHELRVHDLYREAFDPVLSTREWEVYLKDPSVNQATQAAYVDDLRWAEGLVMVYPTFFFGPPAILKGWLERVWLPGVTFLPAAAKGQRARPGLQNIRAFACVTTSGSPWWWLRLARDPNRSLWTRALRPMFHPLCKITWMQLHDMNHVTRADGEKFLAKVEKRFAKLPSA
jgi:putative NADPH-quinone reductase